MYERGDYVRLVDTPIPVRCRVIEAETFRVGGGRSQILKLAPLDGPWPADTMLVRLDHCVTPCHDRGDRTTRPGPRRYPARRPGVRPAA